MNIFNPEGEKIDISKPFRKVTMCEMIKEETGATSRCMPFAQEHLADTCVCCGKPAKTMVYWGKAY